MENYVEEMMLYSSKNYGNIWRQYIAAIIWYQPYSDIGSFMQFNSRWLHPSVSSLSPWQLLSWMYISFAISLDWQGKIEKKTICAFDFYF